MGNMCSGGSSTDYEAFNYDRVPLRLEMNSKQKLHEPVMVLSINILSQKLIGDELPSYKWKNSEETKTQLLEERYHILTKFLSKAY